ncbi:hypothetical protein JVU11DRAFT_8299 [Chiua virens]|nr:hypothetical protein JVU11DRAFT_8299 [Chiua virens]
MFSYASFGVSAPFDPSFHYVTSPVFSPLILASLRLTFAVYTLVTTITSLAYSSLVLHDSSSYFSYFTDLSYTGLVAYFWASSVQTFAFVLRERKSYPLQTWPRSLQLLHVLLHSTIIIFPIIVTVVYWSLLASASTFETTYYSWENISHHALNTVFVLFEIFFTHSGPCPWMHIPLLVLLLACYLGVAYITYATQGFYTYSFLNPSTEGGLLAAYIVGIAIGCCVLFSIVKGVCHLRRRISLRYGLFEEVAGGEDTEALEEWQAVTAPKESSEV